MSRLIGVARSARNARVLAELAARLEFVGASKAPLKEPVRLDRTNTAYHDLYRMAKLFLSGDWQSTATGKSLGFSLLFSMPKLFESFVGRRLRRAVAPRRTDLQSTGHSALRDDKECEDLFQLRPDIVVETPTVVLDTKWKKLKPEDRTVGVSEADVYQILNYGQAYEAKELVLLYPWREGLKRGINRSWRVQGADRHLRIATVDVGDPSTVGDALCALVRKVTEYPAERPPQHLADAA